MVLTYVSKFKYGIQVSVTSVIALSLHPGLKLGRLREWHTTTVFSAPPFSCSCAPQAVLCSCHSDPTSGSVRGTSGEQSGVSCGNPTKYVVVPAVLSVWTAKAQRRGQTEGRVSIAQQVQSQLKYYAV